MLKISHRIAAQEAGLLPAAAEVIAAANPKDITLETARQYLGVFYPQLLDRKFKGAFCRKYLATERESLEIYNYTKIQRAIRDVLELVSEQLNCNSFTFIDLAGGEIEAIRAAFQDLKLYMRMHGDDCTKILMNEANVQYDVDSLYARLESLYLMLSTANIYHGRIRETERSAQPRSSNNMANMINRSGANKYNIDTEIALVTRRFIDAIYRINKSMNCCDVNNFKILPTLALLIKIACCLRSDVTDKFGNSNVEKYRIIPREEIITQLRNLTPMDLLEHPLLLNSSTDDHSTVVLGDDYLSNYSSDEYSRIERGNTFSKRVIEDYLDLLVGLRRLRESAVSPL